MNDNKLEFHLNYVSFVELFYENNFSDLIKMLESIEITNDKKNKLTTFVLHTIKGNISLCSNSICARLDISNYDYNKYLDYSDIRLSNDSNNSISVLIKFYINEEYLKKINTLYTKYNNEDDLCYYINLKNIINSITNELHFWFRYLSKGFYYSSDTNNLISKTIKNKYKFEEIEPTVIYGISVSDINNENRTIGVRLHKNILKFFDIEPMDFEFYTAENLAPTNNPLHLSHNSSYSTIFVTHDINKTNRSEDDMLTNQDVDFYILLMISIRTIINLRNILFMSYHAINKNAFANFIPFNFHQLLSSSFNTYNYIIKTPIHKDYEFNTIFKYKNIFSYNELKNKIEDPSVTEHIHQQLATNLSYLTETNTKASETYKIIDSLYKFRLSTILVILSIIIPIITTLVINYFINLN